jgi:hypothetical protein
MKKTAGPKTPEFTPLPSTRRKIESIGSDKYGSVLDLRFETNDWRQSEAEIPISNQVLEDGVRVVLVNLNNSHDQI